MEKMVLRSRTRGGGSGHEPSRAGASQEFRITEALGPLSLAELDVL